MRAVVKTLLCLLLLSTLNLQLSTAFAQGTAFTYQGRLTIGTNPANGRYDLQFRLLDAPTPGSGTQFGTTQATNFLAVSNGLFTVTLDFGAEFDGNPRWLELSVRTNGAGAFSTLSPRQNVTPAPYAITASSLSGTLPSAQLAGTYGNGVTFNNAANSFTGFFFGTGSGLANVNAATLGGLNSSSFWKTTGNAITTAGTHFLGTTDNQPLEFKVNGERALRIEPTPPFGSYGSHNIIGGSQSNVVDADVFSATISGGGTADFPNRVSLHFGTVGGGAKNTSGHVGTVSGGFGNTASGRGATVGGGGYDGFRSRANIASGDAAVIAGGLGNIASGTYATIPGGSSNAAASYSFAAGYRAKATNQGSFVWADSTEADFGTTANNQFLIRAGGGVGIGTASPLALLNVNGNTRIEATSAGYSEGLSLNLPTDMPGGGYGGIHFHNAARGSNYDSGTIKWGIFYNYTPEGNVGGAGLAFVQNNANTRLYLAQNGRVGIGTNNPQSALHVVGTVTATAFNPPSDRNLKENFAPVSPREVLDKVAALPISRWNFKGDDATPHVGPMAQDFHAAFGLGTDDKHIATVDADGVALAAIQGLNQKVEELKKELNHRDTENTELRHELSEIKRLLVKLATKRN